MQPQWCDIRRDYKGRKIIVAHKAPCYGNAPATANGGGKGGTEDVKKGSNGNGKEGAKAEEKKDEMKAEGKNAGEKNGGGGGDKNGGGAGDGGKASPSIIIYAFGT